MWILRERERERERERQRKLWVLVFFVWGCDCILEQSSGAITTTATAAFDSFALGGVYSWHDDSRERLEISDFFC